MSSAAVRKQAPRLPKPAIRYWKGKAPKGVADVDSDSDQEEALSQEEPGDVPVDGVQDIVVEQDDQGAPISTDAAVKQTKKAMNVSLKHVNISVDGKVIVAGREESGRTLMEVVESDEEGESEARVEHQSESDESIESGSGSEDEEEEEKPTRQFRPVFVPKRARVTILESEALAQDSEEALKKKELEAEERRRQSHNLVAESIKRELAEKEKEELVPDVDDTDGLDPAAEFESWRLRELGRIKKEKQEEIRREEEREEIERRRALPEEQRLKEDLERAQKLREEKPKGQQKFLQKYWHKGAFHQDEEILKRHDFTEATESTVDVSLLPKVMQVKNFGKRSRTKYTHLLDQDTTVSSGGFGGTAPTKAGGKPLESAGCFLCGGPHLKKDCPQNTGPLSSARSGANAALSARPRQWGTSRETGSWRDRGERHPSDIHPDRGGRYDDEKQYRDRDRDRDRDPAVEARDQDRHDRRPRQRSISRSRSRSPRPRRYNHDDGGGRRNERRRSRSVDRDYRDKRRRLD